MTDFIEEVDEHLRSERYLTLARQWAPWFLAALAAAVVGWLGVWGYNVWQDRNIGKASIAYDKALTSLAQGDETGAYTGFEALGKSGPAGYRTLALMQQGNIRLAGAPAMRILKTIAQLRAPRCSGPRQTIGSRRA